MTIKDAGGIQVTVCHTYLCMYLAAAGIFQHILEKDSPASIGSERNSLIFLLKDPQNFTI